VAIFDVDAPYSQPFDFALLRDMPVSLIQRDVVLSGSVEALRQLGYWIVEVDASRWDAAGMFKAVAGVSTSRTTSGATSTRSTTAFQTSPRASTIDQGNSG